MAGGDGVEAVVAGPLEEHAELDLAVAHHVGIRREAAPVAVEQVVDDAGAVLVHEVDDAELDAEAFGGGAGVVDVLLPGAFADDVVLVDPVLHVRADELVAFALQEERGHGAVDSAGHGDEDAHGVAATVETRGGESSVEARGGRERVMVAGVRRGRGGAVPLAQAAGAPASFEAGPAHCGAEVRSNPPIGAPRADGRSVSVLLFRSPEGF